MKYDKELLKQIQNDIDIFLEYDYVTTMQEDTEKINNCLALIYEEVDKILRIQTECFQN